MNSPYLDHVGRIVGGLTLAKCRQSLFVSRQETVYECVCFHSSIFRFSIPEVTGAVVAAFYCV